VSRVRQSLSHRRAEDSPSCLPWLLLALSSNLVPRFIRGFVFVFSFPGKFLFLPFAFVFALRQAAIGSLLDASALIPMAQMKPSNSRPTAVMIFLWSFPAAASRV
jgi:hypothetical protein